MNSNISNSKAAISWLIIIICSVIVLLQQTLWQQKLPIETNILALLPENEQDPFAQQAFQQVTDNLSNKVVFLIATSNKQQAFKATDYFTALLPNTELFASISSKVTEQEQQAWAHLYFPYRAQLLTEIQKQRLQNNPERQVNEVIQQVYNPFSGVTGRELENDPFLLFREYMVGRVQPANKISLQQGYLTAVDEHIFYVVVHAELADSPYNLNLQSKLSKLTDLEKLVETRFNVKLSHTGTLFYASYGTKSAKNEISTIGVGSLMGIMILLLLVYRSALPLFLALLSISCGLLLAFVVTIFIYKKVHLFSLVFGASLIGVSIDYAFHFLTERLLNKDNWNAQLALKHIFNAITLGLITSLIGYVALLVAPFPGLQQLSLFSVVGLIAAYLTVVCWYPLLAKSASRSVPPNLMILKYWILLWEKPTARIMLPLLILGASLVAFSQVKFDDDIRQLQTMPASLKNQEQLIKNVIGIGQDQKMLLVKANSEQLLLTRLKQVSEQLEEWKKQGLLTSYQSISQYLPSIEEQQSNYLLVNQLYQSQSSLLSEKLNFIDDLQRLSRFNPLTANEYLTSPAAKELSFLWLAKIEGKNAAIILINDLTQIQKLIDYSETATDLSYLNKVDEISAIFKQYRKYISYLLAIAYLMISVLVMWRYPFRQALLVLIPPFIAACAGLAITSVVGISISIFNLLALILVLGIGIDYTLFFAEQKQLKSENTLLAITLSAITTILSFGLLALSETQAIHGFGITVLSGMVVAWLLAPLAMKKGF